MHFRAGVIYGHCTVHPLEPSPKQNESLWRCATRFASGPQQSVPFFVFLPGFIQFIVDWMMKQRLLAL